VKQLFVAQRAESRVDMKLTAMLIGTHGKLGVERAVTENVSSRGARVISTSEWFIDDTILVSLPAGHFTSAARVAYCDEMGRGRFVTGLEFVGSIEPLAVSLLVDEEPEPPQM
jgi:PilZ domain